MRAGMLEWTRSIALAVAIVVPLPLQAAVQGAPLPALCPAPDSAGLLVRFFDVGQGDAALLATSDGRHVLVDGGPNAARVMQYLTAVGVRSIDLMIASHNHLDHIGGLPAVLEALPVANVIENGIPATTQVYARFITALERSGARLLRADDREVGVGSLRLRIIPPWARTQSQNLSSVGTVATFGDFRVLFTGDAEGRALQSWTTQGLIPAVAVVKVGHHGGRNGTTSQLVAAARPRLAVISVGGRNSYGHPAPGVVASWASAGAGVMRTDEHGTIIVRGCADGSFSLATSSSRQPAGRE